MLVCEVNGLAAQRSELECIPVKLRTLANRITRDCRDNLSLPVGHAMEDVVTTRMRFPQNRYSSPHTAL